MAETIAITDFERVDIRVGCVLDAQPFPEARKPALKLTIDFGPEIGVRRSSAQITRPLPARPAHWPAGRGVVNFPPRQIGPFVSEVLTLGFPDEDGAVVLIKPDFKVPDGGKAVLMPLHYYTVTWDQLHRDARALAWRLIETGPLSASSPSRAAA